MTEDEMAGWRHRLDGHGFEQALGDSGGQRLASCTPWGHRVKHNLAIEQQQHRRPWFDSWVGKICWRTGWLPTPAFVGFPGGSVVKNPPAMQGAWVRSLGGEGPLEEGKATPSSILAWRIPRTV